MKVLLRACGFFLLSVVASTAARTQWMQMNGPYGAPVWAVAANGINFFAATDAGVSYSTNNGNNWTTVKLPKAVKCLGMQGTTVFAGASGGVYRSTDNGTTWMFAANKGINAVQITAITSLGGYLYAGNMYGVSRSSDNGENWTLVNSGGATGLAIAGSTIFKTLNGTNGGVFRSNDSGATWTRTSTGITDNDVMTVTSSGAVVYTGCANGEIFRSTDNGSTWVALKTGLKDTIITSIAVSGSTITAGTRGAGIFRTTDNGAHWTRDPGGLNDHFVNGIVSTGLITIAGTYGGAFRSTDDGITWTEINRGLVLRSVNSLAVSSSGRTLLAGCADGGVYRSPDRAATWYSPNIGLKKTDGTTVNTYALAVTGSQVIAGTDGAGHVYKSTNDGITWITSSTGLPARNVVSLLVSGTDVFAGIYTGGVYRSSDNGVTWTESDAGLPASATVYAFCRAGTTLFCAPFASGVYSSSDNGTTWTASRTGLPAGAGVKSLLAGTDNTGKAVVFAGMDGYGIYRSTDNGSSWAAFGTGLTQHAAVNAMANVGGMLFAGTEADSIYMSTDNGTTWVKSNTGLADRTVNAFLVVQDAFGGADLYAATGSNGVYRYTGNISLRPGIAVTRPSTPAVGAPFWLEIKIGDRIPVAGLYGIAFKLRSDKPTCSYVDGSAAVGGFADPAALTYFRMADSQTLDVAVTKTSAPGMAGNGILVKAQYVTTVGGNVRFTIDELKAIDQNGLQIPLDTTGLTVSFGGPLVRPVGIAPYQQGKPFWVQVQVGGPDTIRNLYGVSMKLHSSRSTCTYVDGSAAAGTLLGTTPLTMFRKVDAQTVDIAVTKIAAPGITGSGVAAKAQFTSATTEGVTFSLFDIMAIDQSGIPILLGAETLTIASVATGVEATAGVPTEFQLMQNFPNPFNPSTTIRFSLPVRSFVSLKVFDLLGREISTLVSQELGAGTFSACWEPTVPSGIYVYQLRAGEYLQTKRMVVVK
jgi:photosystem II stability/assembly factor-like uncharacterized protein